MTETSVYCQPGFVLHQRQYRESSLIIEVLTQDFGKVSLLAKGVKKAKSKNAGLFRPFSALQLSFSGKSELKVLMHIEAIPPDLMLSGKALYCGFYLNELITHFLYKYDPCPEVYQLYRAYLMQLSKTSVVEPVLRKFELNLLTILGYGLQLDYDVHHRQPVAPDKYYHFNPETGPIYADQGSFSGKTLLALHEQQLTDDIMVEAKRIMRKSIDYHLQGKVLKSRAVIADVLRRYESISSPLTE